MKRVTAKISAAAKAPLFERPALRRRSLIGELCFKAQGACSQPKISSWPARLVILNTYNQTRQIFSLSAIMLALHHLNDQGFEVLCALGDFA